MFGTARALTPSPHTHPFRSPPRAWLALHLGLALACAGCLSRITGDSVVGSSQLGANRAAPADGGALQLEPQPDGGAAELEPQPDAGALEAERPVADAGPEKDSQGSIEPMVEARDAPMTAELGLPCEVKALLVMRCQGCHGSPLAAPMPLVTYDDLVAPAVSNHDVRVVDMVIARMKRGDMPPFPPAVSADEIGAVEAWTQRGAKPEACGPAEPAEPAQQPQDEPASEAEQPVDEQPQDEPSDDDEHSQAEDDQPQPSDDPFGAEAKCSSDAYYVKDAANPSLMHPGSACLSCHSASGSAPAFTIAGTVYLTAHEPSECRGVDRSAHATVVITGSDGAVLMLPVNSSGNFYSDKPVALPLRAQVLADDRERHMNHMQMTGDCNGCHTQSGDNGAPGRIVLP